MYLGLNLSHDASAALINENGQILYAVGEERISRIKNHIGIPRLAIAEIIKETKDVDIDTVVYGSHQMLQPKHLDTFLAQEAGNPSSPRRKALSPFLGYSAVGVKNVMENPKKIHEFLVNEFPELVGTTPKFVRHHDSHVGCALSLACDRDTLIISLDGSGDGESGVIALFKSKTAGLITLSRISELDSLGLLYSAVTANYNFKPTHHEGKITGLAAFGQDAILTHKLEKYVRSKNGQVKLVFAKTKFTSRLLKLLEKSGFNTSKANSLDDIITKVLLTSIKYEYPDLAFAVQEVLETTVCKMVAYWVTQTNVSQVALTGGVFANVKLNQRITEVPGVRFVKVFPNMGDGGIAIGSVWSHMNTNGFNFESNLVSSMDLGTPFDSRMRTSSNLKAKKTEYPEGIIHKVVADKIIEGKVVAVLNG
jgi:carbamoyltransferase